MALIGQNRRGVWTRQPQIVTQPSAVGRLFSVIYSAAPRPGSLFNLVTGQSIGALSAAPGPAGIGMLASAAGLAATLTTGDVFTRGFVTSGITQGGAGTAMFSGDMQFQVTSTALNVNRAGAFNYISVSLDMAKPHSVVLVCDGSSQTLYVDGVLAGSYLGPGGYSGATAGFFGTNGDVLTTGQLYAAFDSAGAIPKSLAQSISANPWQLLAPKRTRRYISLGAGGATPKFRSRTISGTRAGSRGIG